MFGTLLTATLLISIPAQVWIAYRTWRELERDGLLPALARTRRASVRSSAVVRRSLDCDVPINRGTADAVIRRCWPNDSVADLDPAA